MCCYRNRSAILKTVEIPPEKPAMDVNALLKTYEDDTEFVVELMGSCMTTFTEYKESLQRTREYQEVSEIAHALKGCAGNLECCSLQRASSELEILIKSSEKNTFQSVHDQVQVVLLEIQRVLDYVKSHSIFVESSK